MADKILTTDQLIKELAKFSFKQLHIHHTWKPTHRDFNGKNHLQLQQSMRNYHVNTRGWKDIGHHLALMPDGKWVTGRPFILTPASISGWNTGALAVEMVGNFDKPGTGSYNSSGYDKLVGAQLDSVLALIKYYGDRFGYGGVKFHREGPGVTKTCPGTSLDKATMISQAKNLGREDANLRYGQVLKKGAKGAQVKKLQEDLIKLGYGKYMEPYGADGSFGGATLKAVEAFQKANGLAVDGSVGPATQKKIAELLKAPAQPDYKKLYEDEKKKRESAESKLAAIKNIIG
jgi:hypothetical protein